MVECRRESFRDTYYHFCTTIFNEKSVIIVILAIFLSYVFKNMTYKTKMQYLPNEMI